MGFRFPACGQKGRNISTLLTARCGIWHFFWSTQKYHSKLNEPLPISRVAKPHLLFCWNFNGWFSVPEEVGSCNRQWLLTNLRSSYVVDGSKLWLYCLLSVVKTVQHNTSVYFCHCTKQLLFQTCFKGNISPCMLQRKEFQTFSCFDSMNRLCGHSQMLGGSMLTHP